MTSSTLASRLHQHRFFPLNTQGKDYFVGDIHGQYDALMTSLTRRQFDFEHDRLFALGDLIDRGPDSEKCLDLLMQPWFFSVLGNHEHMFLSAFEKPMYWQVLRQNGGDWLDNYLTQPKQLMAWAHLIRLKMAFIHTVATPLGNVGICHAMAPTVWPAPDYPLDQEVLQQMIWHRPDFDTDTFSPIENIHACVHGHTRVTHANVKNNQIWLDTFDRTGQLTLLDTHQLLALL